jgi:hypothetical protein
MFVSLPALLLAICDMIEWEGRWKKHEDTKKAAVAANIGT